MTWLHPAGSLATPDADVLVTPAVAGWDFSGIRVVTMAPEATVSVELIQDEAVIVPLSARDVSVTVDGQAFTLAGRDGVFASVSDWLYAPVGSTVTLAGEGGEVAVCTARAHERHPVVHVAAAAVAVEVRGGGRATRQVTNIATPDSFTGAHRINVCEVITPGGNWSSWPPHRHDGIGDCPVMNEEIYYFRIGREESPHGDPTGSGLFRVYTVDGSVDETVTLRDGDVYLVPQGYHGPSVAPPEYPMYFLNVLAGPGEDRTMSFCDDPSHHWIRESWNDQEQDPRLPWTSAAGRTMKG
jgi:5-deoxy-glucuronate isomerase